MRGASMPVIKGYFAVTKMIVAFIVANRTAHLLRVLGDILQVAVIYYIWSAAYTQAATYGDLGREQMVTYLFVAQVFRIMMNQTYEGPYANTILSGDIARNLMEPQIFMLREYCFGIGYAAAMAAVAGLPLFLAGLLFFGVSLPALASLPALLVSLFLAMSISFALSFIVGTMAFWTEGSIWGISAAKRALAAVAGGALVPLSLFPAGLRRAVELLPFQAGIYLPTSIYLGNLQGAALWQALGVQLGWSVALLGFANWLFFYGLRKVTIPGG